MIPLEGSTAARLANMSRDFAELRKRVDQMPSREGLTARTLQCRIAKTTSVGTYPTSGDTFSIVFVDGTYTEAEGNQTPTYTERQVVGQWFVHNLAEQHIPANTYIIVVRQNGKWWTFYSTSSSENPIIRFQLTQLKHYAADAVGKLVEWDGADYTATGADVALIDTYGVWGRAEIDWFGWAVQMSDRSPVTVNGVAYTDVYDILWCQGWPRHINVLLYENMGATTTQHADATVVKAWGDADNGAGVSDLVGEHVDVYDIRNRWPWATSGQSAYCVYYEILHQYYVEELPEITAYGCLQGSGNVTSGITTMTAGVCSPIHNVTFDNANDWMVVDIPGDYEFHLSCHIQPSTAAPYVPASQVLTSTTIAINAIFPPDGGGAAGINLAGGSTISILAVNDTNVQQYVAMTAMRAAVPAGTRVRGRGGANPFTYADYKLTMRLLKASDAPRPVLPADIIAAAMLPQMQQLAAQQAAAVFSPPIQNPSFGPFF